MLSTHRMNAGRKRIHVADLERYTGHADQLCQAAHASPKSQSTKIARAQVRAMLNILITFRTCVH